MPRWKSGAQGAYYDPNDDGPDQVAPPPGAQQGQAPGAAPQQPPEQAPAGAPEALENAIGGQDAIKSWKDYSPGQAEGGAMGAMGSAMGGMFGQGAPEAAMGAMGKAAGGGFGGALGGALGGLFGGSHKSGGGMGSAGINGLLGQGGGASMGAGQSMQMASTTPAGSGQMAPAGQPPQNTGQQAGMAPPPQPPPQQPAPAVAAQAAVAGAPTAANPNWNTDQFAAPAYTAQNANQQAMAGWDQNKWGNADHQTPKYAVGRILSQFTPSKEGLGQAAQEIAKAYPGATFNGKDKVNIPGVGEIDMLTNSGSGQNMAWNWGTGDDGIDHGGPKKGGKPPGMGGFNPAAPNVNGFDQNWLQKFLKQMGVQM